jgi:predicted alpha/beta-fold hydrolase
MLERAVTVKRRLRPDVPAIPAGPRPCTLRDFDDLYTAPVSGFGTAENYYRLASARPRIGDIRRPALIIAADDDPMIPGELFRDLPQSDYLQVHVTRGGGHLGFLARARAGADADRRWIDWRILEWVLAREAMTKEGTEGDAAPVHP